MGESIWREEKIDGVTYKVVKKSFFIKNLEGFEELKEEEEERIVVAAPLEKLVRMLCHPWGLYDSHIGGILFSTYRSFSSSLQLLTTIFQWLDEVVEEARKDKSKQIQIRSIEGIIEDWVHNYPDDFNDPPTYPTLITLLQLSQQHNLISLSSVVRQSFQHFIKLTEATSDSDPIETPNQDNPLQEKLSLYKIVQQVLDDKENNNNNKDKNNNSNNKDNNKNNNYEGNSTNDDDSGTFDVKRSSEVNSTNKRLSTLDDEEEDGGDDNDVDDGYINHLPATRSTSFDSYNMNNKNNNNNKLHPPLTPPINLINIPPRFFALQLTYADARLFSAVQRHHCLGSCWSNRRKKMAYLNTNNYPISVLATVDHFNAVSYRVISSILKRSTSSFHRSLVLSAWINIALECHLLKNYSSLKAILAGLQSNAIYRLKKLWSCLSKEKMELYRKLTDIFDENNNSALWRKLIMEEDALIKEEKVLRRRKTKMKAGTTSNSPVCGKPVCHEASSWGKTTRNKINWNIKDLELTSATSTSLSSFSSSSSPSSPFKGTIPYLGIFLTDLTMLDAALKDYEEEEEEEDDGGYDDDDFRASMITDFSDEEENVNKNDNKNNNRNNNIKSNNEDYAGYSGLDSSRASYNVENDDSFDNKMNNNNNNNNNESKSLSTDTLENESPYEDKDNYNNKKRNNKHNKKNNKEMKKKKIRIINVDKKRREFEILERIHKLQAGLSYEGIEADTCFMQWFYYMRTYDDNESYELSLELEPNEVTHHQNNSNNNNNNNNNNNRKNNKGSLSPRDHYRNFNLGYFTIRKRSGEGNLNYFRFEPRTNKPTNHLKNLVALTQAPSKQLDTISMLVKSTPTTNPTNQKPPNGHPPKLLNYVKETNIIKAKVFLESSFSHETNQYKSIVIKNTDHTTAVLEKILQKFNLETLSVELFYMVQLLPDKKELKLPEKGNMYYAIKHVPDVTLLVRGRNEKQRKVGGPSRRRSSAVPFIKSIYPSFHPSAHHPSNNNPPSIHPSTHNEDCHVGFYKKIDPDCNNNYNHLYNNNITSNNNNNNNNSNNNNYHFKTSFNNIAINNTNNGNNINNNHNNKNNYCHVTTSNESLHSPLPHNHPSHPRRHFWQKNCVYEMEGGDKKRNRLSRIFGSVVSLVNS